MVKKQISFGKIFLGGIIYTVIATILHWIEPLIAMKYYTMEEFFPVWSRLMMPNAGPPPASFMIYSVLFTLVGGILFALVYAVIKEGVPGKTLVKKGLIYGSIVFLLAGIPTSLMLYLLINLPSTLIWLWAVEVLVIYLLGGMIVAKVDKS